MHSASVRSMRLLWPALGLVLLAGCATAPGTRSIVSHDPAPMAAARGCHDCGRIESITRVQDARPATGTGAVLGGVVGAIAGRSLADNRSEGRQNTATVVGAVAGAAAGHAIESRAHAERFDVVVRMDDGRRLTLNLGPLPSGIAPGRSVRWDGRNLIPLH